MIKCVNGNVDMHGNGPSLLADFATIVHSLHYGVFIDDKGFSPEKSRELILKAVEKGFKDDKEIEDEAKECLLDVLDKIKELLTGKDDE